MWKFLKYLSNYDGQVVMINGVEADGNMLLPK